MSALTIHLTADTTGRDTATCEWQGRQYTAATANGATMKLCRALVSDGCPDLPWTVPGRLSGSVHTAAVRTIGDAGFIPWTPHPRAEIAGALARLVARDAAARAARRAVKTPVGAA